MAVLSSWPRKARGSMGEEKGRRPSPRRPSGAAVARHRRGRMAQARIMVYMVLLVELDQV